MLKRRNTDSPKMGIFREINSHSKKDLTLLAYVQVNFNFCSIMKAPCDESWISRDRLYKVYRDDLEFRHNTY